LRSLILSGIGEAADQGDRQVRILGRAVEHELVVDLVVRRMIAAFLEAFLSGPYHAPEDEPGPRLMLDGAAEDANLLVALGRRLADPGLYRRPGRRQP